MSIRSDMLNLAGLHNKAKEVQLNEMGLREIGKDFKILVNKAYMAYKSGDEAATKKYLQQAAIAYVDKTSFYTKKTFDAAALTARRGWSKTSENAKIKEIFKNDQVFIRMFGNFLMQKVGDIEAGKESEKIRKKQEKGVGKKTVFNKETGKKEEIEIKTQSSVSKQRKIKTDLLNTVQKVDKERAEMLNDIESGDETKIKEVAKKVSDIWDSEGTKTKESVVIKNFINGKDIELELIKNILIEKLKIGGSVLEMLVRASLEAKGLGTLSDEQIEAIQKRMGIIEKRKAEKEKINLKQQQQKNEDSFNKQGIILAESLRYEGSYFWENYIFTQLLRRFTEDSAEFGIEETQEMYTELFGYETMPIWEHMANNEDALYEIYEIKGKFLFEEIGYRKVSLNERITAIGFLKGLWQKIKDFGAPIINKIKTWAGPAISWIKGILSQGIKFVTTNPIAKIAVPAVVMAGSIVGAIVLINKLRKKANMKKLNKQEIDEMREVLASKEDELEILKKKGVPNIDKIKREINSPKIRVAVN